MYFANFVGLLKLYEIIHLLYFCSTRDFIALFNDVFTYFQFYSSTMKTKTDNKKDIIYPLSSRLFLKYDKKRKRRISTFTLSRNRNCQWKEILTSVMYIS